MKIFKFLTVIILMLQVNYVLAQSSQETVYFYAVGWEYLPQNDRATLNVQPVVSNVVRINCNGFTENSSLGVDNQLNDFYSAYHGKQRGFLGLNRITAFGPFSSWDEAENHRRQNISTINRQWNPFLLQHFRYLCEE